MPQFVFKLDGVLRHRERGEQHAQRAVAEKLADVTRLERELRALNDDLTTSTASLRDGKLTGPLDLSYLAAHRRYVADVTRRGAGLMQQIAAAQRLVDAARRELAEAAKQRKILETLRERHLAAWKAERSRRELAEDDDAAGRMSYATLADGAETDIDEDAT